MSGNILIIDDSPIDRKIIRSVLEIRLKNINFFEADGSCDTRSLLLHNNISVCILDIVMPTKTGFEILDEIKKDSDLVNIPVIVCTGLSENQAIEKALTLGAYDYFSKPLSEDVMKISLPLKVKNAIELNRRSEDLLYLSYHDKLTNLFNRRYYEEKVNLLDASNHLPISFIIGDVNGLKLTNDTYGHEAGDNLLVKISDILKESCRIDDIISRTGGDEFLVILPQTTSSEAEKIAEDIKSRCSAEKENPIQPSISLGIATKHNLKQDIKDVYRLAEERMYSNKLTESKNVKDSIILSLRKTLQNRLQSDK